MGQKKQLGANVDPLKPPHLCSACSKAPGATLHVSAFSRRRVRTKAGGGRRKSPISSVAYVFGASAMSAPSRIWVLENEAWMAYKST